jgi:hypothetical protein
MMKQRGFTLIETMVVVIIIMAVSLMVMGVVGGSTQGNTISYGINGLTEMRCIDGYKFIVGQDGNIRQVLDEFGKAAKCQ